MANKSDKDRTRKWMSILGAPQIDFEDNADPNNMDTTQPGGFEQNTGQKSNLLKQVQLQGNDKRYNQLFQSDEDNARTVENLTSPSQSSESVDIDSTGVPGPAPVSARTPGYVPGPQNADERLADKLAKTNYQPRSIWQRLLRGAVSQAATINPATDTGGTALGKIIGGAVAQGIPQVDVGIQQEEGKQKALKQYGIERTAEENKAKRDELKLKQDKLQLDAKQEAAKQKAAAENQRLLNAARLRDDQRAEANQLLDIVKGLPKDDPERKALTKTLNEKYGIKGNFSRFGEKEEEFITIQDTETGEFIRATKDGTPVLNPTTGKPIVVKSGEPKGVKEQAEADVAPVMQGALRAQALQEARQRFPKAAKLDDAKLLENETYGGWVQQRTEDLVEEETAKRSQEVNRRTAAGKQGKGGQSTATKSTAKVPPSKSAVRGTFDLSTYLNRQPVTK